MKFDYGELGYERKSILAARKRIESFLSDKGISLNLDTPEFHTDAVTLKELKIAAIMDEFTFFCYQPECVLFGISPDNFEQELASFQPDMLFVESAWNGNHGLWKDKIAHGSKEYFALASYCHKKHIPIIFWNKEDPFHFEDFLIIAKTADFVFTTDSDMIPQYRSRLGTNSIYHLHFAAQPRIHNPIEIGNRQDKFCFAGAYYRCYPERAEVFERFAQVFLSTKGLAIYDREYGKRHLAYKFPSKYKPYILGNLKADEIEKAHKGYIFGINMNTVTSSSTMFSRRVFELMASNTVTVGNYAKGLENYFGNRTICTNDANVLIDKLENYCATKAAVHKYRLLGLREILTAHLYEDRLSDIVKTVYNLSLKKSLPCITVISQVQNELEYQWIMEEFKTQTYEKKQLFLFYGDELALGIPDISSNEHTMQSLLGDTVSSEYIAYFHPWDYYAPNYLYDLIYTLRYCDSRIIGKNAFYSITESSLHHHSGTPYCYGDNVAVRRAIINIEFVSRMTIQDFFTLNALWGRVFYIDEWNYCENTHCVKCKDVEDMELF